MRTQSALLTGVGCLVVFAAAAGAGYLASSRLLPEWARAEVERRLAEAVGSPVQIGGVRLGFGLGLRLELKDLQLWPRADGIPGLEVDRVAARLRALPLLRGELRLGRLLLAGARLRIERDRTGSWSPAFPAPPAEPGAAEALDPPEEWLSPLIALETAVRQLLDRRDLAGVLELRDGEILFSDAFDRERPLTLSLKGLQAQLRQRSILGDARLGARARLIEGNRERGRIEWEGSRGRGGEIRLAMATTALEMEAVAPYLRALYPRAQVGGIVSGALAFETTAPGEGRLEVDLVVRDLEALLRPGDVTAYGPVFSPRTEVEVLLEITPERVGLERARITSGELELRTEGILERPLRPESIARLALSFDNVDFTRARSLLGWLPQAERDTLAAVVEPVEAGRLVRFTASGSAPLAGWEDLFAGRTLRLPVGFAGQAEFADGVVRVGDSDRLERLSGRLAWQDDRIRVRRARAELNGTPLPRLELVLDGVSHLFAAEASRRALSSGALPLVGLRPLWEVFRPEPRSDGEPRMRTTARLEIASLQHPMFLFPIENLRAVIEPVERGIHIEVSEGSWAGVPVRADANWLFRPDEELQVHLTAETPHAREGEAPAHRGWAEGSFELGALQSEHWRQAGARGRFTATGGRVRLEDVEIDLEPSGRMRGSVALDLARTGAVPYQLNFALTDGDAAAVMEQTGLGAGLATGHVDLSGTFEGRLEPGVPISRGISGLLSIEASGGIINRGIPPVLAIALASETFNPFARRDAVRYRHLETVLEFGERSLSTEGFALDGPDLRIFARGKIDLAHPPHEIDAEVALFLFRQLDRAIEKVPLINLLLLGDNENLQAAYYRLSGPWEEPKVQLIPLRSLAAGPATSLLLGVPRFLMRGIQAIDAMLGAHILPEPETPFPKPPVKRPSES